MDAHQQIDAARCLRNAHVACVAYVTALNEYNATCEAGLFEHLEPIRLRMLSNLEAWADHMAAGYRALRHG